LSIGRKLIFLCNKFLTQYRIALDGETSRLWEMVLEDHQKIAVLENQLENMRVSLSDLKKDIADMKKGESRITWLILTNLLAIIIALVEVYVFHL
jgi:hypothetical protein